MAGETMSRITERESPLQKSMIGTRPKKTRAVPRSFCRMTSTAGTTMRAAAFRAKLRSCPVRVWRSESNWATASTVPTLASSDTCSRNGPSASQARVPCTSTPMTSDSTSKTIVAA